MSQYEHFDHVVVGGGAAGAAVAARLVERHGFRVVLLEAGPLDTVPGTDQLAPLQLLQLQRGEFDWCDETVPQPELHGRKVQISSGRVVGGGGGIDYLAWGRGAQGDFDAWADRGMKGWAWRDVLPSLRRLEDHERGESELHGRGGPIAVTSAPDKSPVSLAFLAACMENGLEFNHDFDSGDLRGAGFYYNHIRNGRRSSSREYIVRAMNSTGLSVQVGVVVQRVLVQGQRVVGVEYIDSAGRSQTIATESVVLSAGALRSPQILMLSGIGPAQHLTDLGVEVTVDLPGVGANFHDHPRVPVVWPIVRGRTWLDAHCEESLALYAERKRGPLAATAEVVAHLDSEQPSEVPDIQITPAAIDFTGGTEPSLSLTVGLMAPASRGQLRLATDDPGAAPILDPRYLTESVDRERLVDGIRKATEIAAAPALRVYIGDTPRYLAAGADSAAMLACARQYMNSFHHPVGTCRAGTDDLAVVDPELRVHGIDGLRVIDASVMPDITHSPTHAAAVLIGERGAELMCQQA